MGVILLACFFTDTATHAWTQYNRAKGRAVQAYIIANSLYHCSYAILAWLESLCGLGLARVGTIFAGTPTFSTKISPILSTT